MKKLMFSAFACVAFAFSGFATNEVVNEELSIINTTAEFDTPCSNWVTVNRSCGGEFYLCAENYSSTKELIAAGIKYDRVQCAHLEKLNSELGK